MLPMLAAAPDLAGQMPDYDPTVNMVVAGVFIGWGLLNVLFGYRLFRWIVVLYSAVVGFVLAGVISMSLIDQPIAVIVIAAVAAIVAGVLGWYLYYLLVFLFGMGVGTAVAIVVGSQFLPGMASDLAATAGDAHTSVSPIFLIIALGLGFVCGLVALLVHRPLIIIYTAIYGAISVTLGVFDFLGRTEPVMMVNAQDPVAQQVGRFQSTPLLIAVMAIAAIGVVIQFTVTAKEKQGKLAGESREQRQRQSAKS